MVNIVVIGDSIAKGVGSSNPKTKSYGALIGEKLNGTVTNLGITGLDSNQLIEKIQTEKFQNALKEADVIFVSIGSNDLLKPFLSIVANAAGVSGENKELYVKLQKHFAKLSKNDPLKAGDALATAAKNINKSKELKAACEQFPKNLQKILTELKELNTSAVIYVDNIYNPYYGVVYEYQGLTLLNIHDICENYIVELNKAFDFHSKDYKLMDMYSIFRQPGYTNVNPASLEDMSDVNFDPHPNDQGYQLMADYIYTQMDSIAPKVEALINCDEMAAPIDLEEIQLLFSEEVRVIAGKKLTLASEDKEYVYTLNGEESFIEDSEGRFLLTIPMQCFLEEEQLAYQQEYQLTMEKGAFKDKGNNSPDQLKLLQFQTEGSEELEAHSTTIINPPGLEQAKEAHKIILVSILIFVLIAVAIAIAMRYNKKHAKKS